MKNTEQQKDMFCEQFELLSENQKKAVSWLINNIKIVEELSKVNDITEDEMNSLIQIAKNKEDYITLLLLFYKQIKDKNNITKGIDI